MTVFINKYVYIVGNDVNKEKTCSFWKLIVNCIVKMFRSNYLL